jgi:hypothetical protein
MPICKALFLLPQIFVISKEKMIETIVTACFVQSTIIQTTTFFPKSNPLAKCSPYET